MHLSPRLLLIIPVTLFALLSSAGGVPPEPDWWSAQHSTNSADPAALVLPPVVIDSLRNSNNQGPANIGQAKHMARSALLALRASDQNELADDIELDLVGSNNPITSWDPPTNPTDQEKQKAPLLIGQLKAIAHPFYNRLNGINAASDTWVLQQIQLNHPPGTPSIEGIHYWHITGNPAIQDGYYPWNPATPADQNKAIATIGQLKVVFSLRFDNLHLTDTDGDGLPDQWEQVLIEQSKTPSSMTIADINPLDDFDQDGVNNLREYQLRLSAYQSDSDADGYSDRLSVDQNLYLKLDETSGSLASDASGNGRNGALASVASWQATGGIENGALEFHGGTDAVELPADVLNGASDLTVCLWFKTSSISTSQTLLSSVGATGIPEWAIGIENNNTIRVDSGGGLAASWGIGRNLSDGLWHQLVITRDSVAGQVALYLDGRSPSLPLKMYLENLSVDTVVLAQRHQSVSSYDSNQAFVGLLDGVRVYSSVLAAKDVTELFLPNDLDQDGLPDDYELSLFQNLATLTGADDDLDGDGLNNRQEYEGGTGPNDYFNGQTTVITLFSGSGQKIYNRYRTFRPLVFLVANGEGLPFVNAPVSLSHLAPLIGSIETIDGNTLATSLTLRTDSEGKVAVHFKAN